MKPELNPGQAEIVAGKLAQDEALQAADRELLQITTDHHERETILRRIAGREGALSTRRRYLAELTGEEPEGPKNKNIRIRLTDDEYALVTQRAHDACVTLAQYIRSKLFA